MVGHLNSTIEGMTTIRAFKAQKILRNEFDKHQDLYTSAYYTSLCAKRAFAFYMDFFSVVFITFIVMRFLFVEACMYLSYLFADENHRHFFCFRYQRR